MEISLYDPLSKLPVMFVSIKNQLEEMAEPIKKMAVDSESLIMGDDRVPC